MKIALHWGGSQSDEQQKGTFLRMCPSEFLQDLPVREVQLIEPN